MKNEVWFRTMRLYILAVVLMVPENANTLFRAGIYLAFRLIPVSSSSIYQNPSCTFRSCVKG